MQSEELNSVMQHVIQEQARMDEQIKGIIKTIDNQTALMESVRKLATSVEILAASQKITERKVDELADDVGEIKYRPSKRWDTAVTVLITAFVTGFVTFTLSRVGLK